MSAKFHSFLLLLLLLMVVALAPQRACAADIVVDDADSLTTGVLTVANNAYGEFFAPAGRVQVRALDDASSVTTTLAFVQFFTSNPASTDLDASTREKTGIAIQEGDTITFLLEEEGWIGIDGATGTSQIVAIWLKED